MSHSIENSISKIKEIIYQQLELSHRPEVGLLTSLGGYCLFLFNYARTMNDEEAEDKAFIILEEALKTIYTNALKYNQTYCSGIAGFGWLLNHLQKHEFAEVDENIFSEIDKSLAGVIFEELKVGNHDYLHGSLGMFLYYIDRISKKANRKIMERYVSGLNKLKRVNDNGMYWDAYSALDGKITTYTANLGLSHGVPGILAVLSKYHMASKDELSLYLIKKTSSFLLSTKNQYDMISIFPYSYDTKGQKSSSSRLGWCYGDLGVAISLLHAGKAVGDEYIRNEAIEIASHSLKRKDIKENSIVDAGLCHGTAGIAQIFKSFYFETGDLKFLEAANFWFGQTIALINEREGLATGYCKWDSKIGYVNCYGMLEGISGVGLSLLSAINSTQLSWDESLLIS